MPSTTVGANKGIEGGVGIGAGPGHPDRLLRRLGLGLGFLRRFVVQDVRGLVDPAALMAVVGDTWALTFRKPRGPVADYFNPVCIPLSSVALTNPARGYRVACDLFRPRPNYTSDAALTGCGWVDVYQVRVAAVLK